MDDARSERAGDTGTEDRPKGSTRLAVWPLIALPLISAVGCDPNPTAPTAPSSSNAAKADTGKSAPKGAPLPKPID